VRAKTPSHVAAIMDGNGRWAQRRGLPRIAGHLQAHRAVQSTVHAALNYGITHLTLFAFSCENWNRPQEEVNLLMQPHRWLVTRQEVASYRESKVSVSFIGQQDDPRIPAGCLEWMREAEQVTAVRNPQLRLTLAFNYGGRQEIEEAVRRLHSSVASEWSPDDFRQLLWSSDLPDVDLLIRTSGEQRLSNFMLWSVWYAELFFTETLWPDFRGSHLLDAVADYQCRSRRWGAIPSGGPL